MVRLLCFAVESGHHKVTIQLIAVASPTVINAKNSRGRTALHIAADSRGWTALHCAIDHGQNATVQHLLAACPALVDVVELNGWSTLHCAVWSGHVSIAKVLLEINPELVFHHDKQGNSVLHMAILGHCSNAFIAVLHKLNPQAAQCVNERAETPFHMAVRNSNDPLIDLLQWTLTFAEIEKIFTEYRYSLDRYLPVMEQQCEFLHVSLNRDVKGFVFEYLGLYPPSSLFKIDYDQVKIGGVEYNSDGEEDDVKRRKTSGHKPFFRC